MTDAPPNDVVPQESAAGPGPAQLYQLATEASRPRVAIAHDYLTQRGGAERVVLAISRAFPDAPIHTTLYNPSTTFPEFADKNIVASPPSTESGCCADTTGSPCPCSHGPRTA